MTTPSNTPPSPPPFVDTDVIIRLLTGDDLRKQAAARALFERVERGELVVAAPDTVIADAVYVLSSRRLYTLPRDHVSVLLTTLVRLPRFRVKNRTAVLRALELYATTNLDFGDLFIVASMKRAHAQILYSYDKALAASPLSPAKSHRWAMYYGCSAARTSTRTHFCLPVTLAILVLSHLLTCFLPFSHVSPASRAYPQVMERLDKDFPEPRNHRTLSDDCDQP